MSGLWEVLLSNRSICSGARSSEAKTFWGWEKDKDKGKGGRVYTHYREESCAGGTSMDEIIDLYGARSGAPFPSACSWLGQFFRSTRTSVVVGSS